MPSATPAHILARRSHLILNGDAAAAPQGRHVVVDGTGHNIPRDRPDVAADTILAVAAQARANSG